jgi:hypothetical protein
MLLGGAIFSISEPPSSSARQWWTVGWNYILDVLPHAGGHLCCAFLSDPTALTTATGSLQKLGLLITRGHVLEGLTRINTVVLDKTGTLTEGRMTLERIETFPGQDSDTVLELAQRLEARSEHAAFFRTTGQ